MDELEPILSELREALREHLGTLKNMVANYPFSPVDIGKVVTMPDAASTRVRNKKEKAS